MTPPIHPFGKSIHISPLTLNSEPDLSGNLTPTFTESESASWEVPLANIHATLEVLTRKIDTLFAENAALAEKVELLFRENTALRAELARRNAQPDQSSADQMKKLAETCEFLSDKCEYLEKKLERVLGEMENHHKSFHSELSSLKKKHEDHTHNYKYCPPVSSYDLHPRPRDQKTERPNL